MQRGEHQTEFANNKVDKSSYADEQQPRGTSESHGPNALASAILLLTTRQINDLIRSNLASRLHHSGRDFTGRSFSRFGKTFWS
jgi:hypothetical protein